MAKKKTKASFNVGDKVLVSNPDLEAENVSGITRFPIGTKGIITFRYTDEDVYGVMKADAADDIWNYRQDELSPIKEAERTADGSTIYLRQDTDRPSESNTETG